MARSSAEVTVTFRDDEYDYDNEDYESWLRGKLEEVAGITVMEVDIQEV